MGRRRQPFRYLTRLPLADVQPPEGEPPPPEALQRLAEALRRQGQREAVLVTPRGARAAVPYRLVVGRRRLLAARLLGWKEIDAVLLDATFATELAAIEALQAGRHDPWALAAALRSLQERCGWTQAQVGTAIGRNRDFVTGLLAVAAIAPEVREYLQEHANGRILSARHLRYIGRASPRRQLRVAREIVEQGLSAKLLEQRFRRSGPQRPVIKVRALRQPGRSRAPQSTTQWRRYYRKLNTDLRRIDEQERHALQRSDEAIAQARQRQALIRREARAKRQALARELRRATRQLTRRGAL